MNLDTPLSKTAISSVQFSLILFYRGGRNPQEREMRCSHNSFPIKVDNRTPHTMPDQEFKAKMPSAPIPLLSIPKFRIVVPSAITQMNSQKTTRELGLNYVPNDFDIYCGRGKGFYNRPGNKKFRVLVAAHIRTYVGAKSKVDKSAVLNTIIDEVRSTVDPATGRPAQFIKFTKHTGWVEIGDDQAREKVGHAMREAIASNNMTTTSTKPRPLKITPRPSSPIPLAMCSASAYPVSFSILKESVNEAPFLFNENSFTDSVLWTSRRSSFARNSLSSDMMRAAVESFIGV